MTINILLLCGGDGSEHQISLTSSEFIRQKLEETREFRVLPCVIHDHSFLLDEEPGSFNGSLFLSGSRTFRIDCVVPCLHGIPGETGDIQSFLEILDIPYIGCGPEASRNCFNKITAKMYLDALGIPNSPSEALLAPSGDYRSKAEAFFGRYGDVYVKAACQGSSIGCYHVTSRDRLWPSVLEAFNYSSEVLLEKNIRHRELEVAAYELNGGLVITDPGEIIMPDNVFYTFEQKYSGSSATRTTVEPGNLSPEERGLIKELSRRAFAGLKLRDLSRIDFFLSEEDGILINEINTFPGATPISMFPKLLEHHGDSMREFLAQAVNRALERR